jgi:NAD(P)-dependent dehydrogenase (short-subunit alcohol dehydrogenase family)
MSFACDLNGQTALVTGASSGLGRQFALTLASAGARVAVAARRIDRLEGLAGDIRAKGGKAVAVAMDVTEQSSIAPALDAAEAELGPIDILVNNSGVSVQRRIVDVTPEDFAYVMNTNVFGAFFVAQAVARRMIERRTAGRIVNVASVVAHKVVRELSVYGMSKAAIVQMTKSQALEWARHNINVNAICPGYIRTEMNADYWDTERGKKFVDGFPRRRVGKPEDLDGLLLLLCSGQSGFMTGASIAIDDGLSLA